MTLLKDYLQNPRAFYLNDNKNKIRNNPIKTNEATQLMKISQLPDNVIVKGHKSKNEISSDYQALAKLYEILKFIKNTDANEVYKEILNPILRRIALLGGFLNILKVYIEIPTEIHLLFNKKREIITKLFETDFLPFISKEIRENFGLGYSTSLLTDFSELPLISLSTGDQWDLNEIDSMINLNLETLLTQELQEELIDTFKMENGLNIEQLDMNSFYENILNREKSPKIIKKEAIHSKYLILRGNLNCKLMEETSKILNDKSLIEKERDEYISNIEKMISDEKKALSLAESKEYEEAGIPFAKSLKEAEDRLDQEVYSIDLDFEDEKTEYSRFMDLRVDESLKKFKDLNKDLNLDWTTIENELEESLIKADLECIRKDLFHHYKGNFDLNDPKQKCAKEIYDLCENTDLSAKERSNKIFDITKTQEKNVERAPTIREFDNEELKSHHLQTINDEIEKNFIPFKNTELSNKLKKIFEISNQVFSIPQFEIQMKAEEKIKEIKKIIKEFSMEMWKEINFHSGALNMTFKHIAFFQENRFESVADRRKRLKFITELEKQEKLLITEQIRDKVLSLNKNLKQEQLKLEDDEFDPTIEELHLKTETNFFDKIKFEDLDNDELCEIPIFNEKLCTIEAELEEIGLLHKQEIEEDEEECFIDDGISKSIKQGLKLFQACNKSETKENFKEFDKETLNYIEKQKEIITLDNGKKLRLPIQALNPNTMELVLLKTKEEYFDHIAIAKEKSPKLELYNNQFTLEIDEDCMNLDESTIMRIDPTDVNFLAFGESFEEKQIEKILEESQLLEKFDEIKSNFENHYKGKFDLSDPKQVHAKEILDILDNVNLSLVEKDLKIAEEIKKYNEASIYRFTEKLMKEFNEN